MRSFLKYPLIFILAFLFSGVVVFYAIKAFTISAQEVVLPQLKGKNILYVLETLTRLGLNAQLYGTRYDDTVPKYAVITQDPAPGSTIKKGRDVIIYISKGRKENIVPDLRQLELSEALLRLEKLEFKKGHISTIFSAQGNPDHVLAQFPKPFTTALKGSVCNLLVARGPSPKKTMMPDITGLSLNQAARVLEQKRLKPSQITAGKDTTKSAGTVLSQIPAFGHPVTLDDRITLVANNLGEGLTMDPDKLEKVRLVSYFLKPSFLKSRVRIETDYFGSAIDLYNEYQSPGERISLLIPADKKAEIRFFIDNHLETITIVDPWEQEIKTGELPWELLPLQFYLPTLQNLPMN